MLTQIEQALIRCNGDVFANLCRQYLVYKYHNVYPTGFVLGKEKSRIGTPDTFIPIGDYYIFNEITTKQDGVLKKLKEDISHCFKQEDIPKEKIIKIILMFNGQLDMVMHRELKEHLEGHSTNTELEIIDVKNFANQIRRNYASIARELGIAIDTGQILEISEFIANYEKSKFATTLSNNFFNREEEIEKGLASLESKDILLISGFAGTGKTKLSLELTRKYLEKNKTYVPKYIVANGQLDIWNDLNTQILPNEDYLIVLDDANKLKSNLELILNFQNNKKGTGKIKLIITVRNYVRKSVEKLLKEFALVELNPFKKEELKKILQSKEFNISDYYIDRIFDISKGNPRLAIMAAVAGLNNELDKLDNPSQIMEKYFSSVSQSINSFENKNLLKAAGVLAIFKTIDFDNETQINEIEKYFFISKNELNENLKILFQIEIADEFENAYKIADQILGEYIVYLVFIRDKEIPFSKLLEIYLDKEGRFPLGSIILQQINSFSLESIGQYIEQEIKEIWRKIDNDPLALTFIKDFYYYIPNETLSYFSNKTQEYSQENLNEYTFEKYDGRAINSYGDDVIDVLLRFQVLGQAHYLLSLNVLLEYGLTTQLRFHKLLKAYVEGIAMEKNSYFFGYTQQIMLFDFLYSKVSDNPVFYSKVLLFIAPSFLRDNYSSSYSEGKGIVIGNYSVILSAKQEGFRENLWRFIFECYSKEKLKHHTQKCLKEYSENLDYHNKSENVILFDQAFLIEFFENELSLNDFIDNSIIDTYINKLKWIQISVEGKLLKRLKNRAYKLYLKLTDNINSTKEYKLGHDEYESYKTNQLRRFIKDFQRTDFMRFSKDLNVIFSNKDFLDSNSFRLSSSVSRILKIIGNRDFDLFLVLFKKIARSEFASEIQMNYFHELRLNQEKVQRFRTILSKDVYIFHLPQLQVSISKRHLTKRDFELFLKYLRTKRIKYFWFLKELIERLSPFASDTSMFLGKILDILDLRSKKEKIYVPNTFFTYLYETHPKVFSEKFNIVEDLYLRLDENERHFDYSLEVLQIILLKDPDYIIRLLDSHFKDVAYISGSSLLENDFRKLWTLENYQEVFTKILDHSHRFHRVSDNPDTIARIFENNKDKHIKFLKHYLDYTDEEGGILTVFNIVVSLFHEHRFKFLDLVLLKGINIDVFKRLDFVTSSITYSGSIIPRYRHKISEFEEIEKHLQLKGDVKYLPHISEIRRKIDLLKSFIESERKREFLSDWGI